MSGLESRSGTRTRVFRGGNGLGRPAEREARKQPLDPDQVLMPDGTTISRKKFHELRSAAHQLLPAEHFRTCSERVRNALNGREWSQLQQWIGSNVASHRSSTRRINTLIAALLCHAAGRLCSQPIIVLDRIVERRSAKGSLLPG
jgi:hypothetical protein